VELQRQPGTLPGVHQRDAASVFALLLLFHTQRCEPRVQVYVPLGTTAAFSPGVALQRTDSATRAAKLKCLLTVAEQAAATQNEDILRVLRALIILDALAVGAVSQVCGS